MVENQGVRPGGSEQENSWSRSSWPADDVTGERYYQSPLNYGASYPYYPVSENLIKRAEERVKAKGRFFKRLFIYLGVITALWMISITAFLIERRWDDLIEFIALPLIVSVVWGVMRGWDYFKTFIWESKSEQERVQEELAKLQRYQ